MAFGGEKAICDARGWMERVEEVGKDDASLTGVLGAEESAADGPKDYEEGAPLLSADNDAEILIGMEDLEGHESDHEERSSLLSADNEADYGSEVCNLVGDSIEIEEVAFALAGSGGAGDDADDYRGARGGGTRKCAAGRILRGYLPVDASSGGLRRGRTWLEFTRKFMQWC